MATIAISKELVKQKHSKNHAENFHQSYLWIFEFKTILKLFSQQIQNSGIFATRVILGSLSIYPVKLCENLLRFLIHSKSRYIENLREIQNIINLQNRVYTVNPQVSVTLPFKNLQAYPEPYQIFIMDEAFYSDFGVTRAYLEPCHVQKLRNIRNPVKHLWFSIF